jgi:hypothetical protein
VFSVADAGVILSTEMNEAFMNRVPYNHFARYPGSAPGGRQTYPEAKAQANLMWADFQEVVRIDAFRPALWRYPSGICRIGFIDFTAAPVLPTCGIPLPSKARGLVVKTLADPVRAHLDMPTEYSKALKEWFDLWCFRSLSYRICLTALAFKDPEVLQALIDIRNEPIQVASPHAELLQDPGVPVPEPLPTRYDEAAVGARISRGSHPLPITKTAIPPTDLSEPDLT